MEKEDAFSLLEEQKMKRTVEDRDYIIELMGKWEREEMDLQNKPIEEQIEKAIKYDEEEFRNLVHTFPKYYPVESQEMVVYQSKKLQTTNNSSESGLNITLKDKLIVTGASILALAVGLGIVKLSSVKDEMSMKGVNNYKEYVSFAKENDLPISQEGYVNYNYGNNSIDLGNNIKGGR